MVEITLELVLLVIPFQMILPGRCAAFAWNNEPGKAAWPGSYGSNADGAWNDQITIFK